MKSPLRNERFVQGEPVHLVARVTGGQQADGNALKWSSNLDGALGRGADITVSKLSTGTHTIKVAGFGATAARPVRIFPDLGDLYTARPAPAEIARTDKDVSLSWIDGTGVDESWSAYPAAFNQQSTDASKLVVHAKLDVLRHQSFSEPLPFAGGKPIYDFF